MQIFESISLIYFSLQVCAFIQFAITYIAKVIKHSSIFEIVLVKYLRALIPRIVNAALNNADSVFCLF